MLNCSRLVCGGLCTASDFRISLVRRVQTSHRTCKLVTRSPATCCCAVDSAPQFVRRGRLLSLQHDQQQQACHEIHSAASCSVHANFRSCARLIYSSAACCRIVHTFAPLSCCCSPIGARLLSRPFCYEHSRLP